MNTKEIKTKKCSKCGRELPTDNFYKDNRTKDGLYSNCKECHSKYQQTNKQHYNQYHRQYYKTNKEHYSQYQKEYNKQFTGYYVYIILDKQDNVAYVGETTNYYKRLCRHLSGGVDSTKELFANNDWYCIKYLDVSDIVENDLELKAMENELIELYEPRCNTQLNIIHDIDRGRLFSLLAQLHNMNNNDWKIFRVNK